jgi:hypothetical protein
MPELSWNLALFWGVPIGLGTTALIVGSLPPSLPRYVHVLVAALCMVALFAVLAGAYAFYARDSAIRGWACAEEPAACTK